MLFFIRHLIKKCVFHQMTRFKSGVLILYRFNIVNAIYNWYFGGVLLEISDIYIKTTRNATVWNELLVELDLVCLGYWQTMQNTVAVVNMF